MVTLGKVATPRKIIQLGEDTLVVSLPSAWAKHHGLKKGDGLEVDEQGPRLVLYPKSEAKLGRVSIDVSGTQPVTKRIVAALYKAGYDEVEIAFQSQDELAAVERTIRDEFVGFEILSKTKGSLVAKAISQPVHEEFETLLRKVFLLLLEMGNECFRAINSGELGKLQLVADMDRDINRHVNFCRRTLNVIGHRVVGKIAPAYYMVEQLERIGDCYKHLCTVLSKSEHVPSATLKNLLADANFTVRKFYELYYTFSLLGLAEFWKEKERVEKSVAEAFEVAGKREAYALFLISEVIENVADANGALLTARL